VTFLELGYGSVELLKILKLGGIVAMGDTKLDVGRLISDGESNGAGSFYI
jgi:hypothetical protein